MEGHHYTDENGYGYSYDPNQMYYIDPNMQQVLYIDSCDILELIR